MPTPATSVAPMRMPTIWARAGPLKASSTAITTAAYIARPPRSGIGVRCTLRGPGRSTIPTRSARARTGTTSINDANRAMKNANRPAAMHPRASGEPPDRWPVTHEFLAGSVPGSQVKQTECCLTQPKHDTAILVPRQSGKICRCANYSWSLAGALSEDRYGRQLPGSTLRQHPGEDALYFFFVACGVVPVDGALEAFAEENFWFPAEEFPGER